MTCQGEVFDLIPANCVSVQIGHQDLNLYLLFQACKFDFEDGTLGGWKMTGTVFDNQPTYGDNPTARNRGQPAKQQGDYWVGGYEDRHTPDDTPGEVQGDGPTGTLTSPFFKITGRYITFLVGGGCDANLIHADLIIDGVVRNNVVRALIFF